MRLSKVETGPALADGRLERSRTSRAKIVSAIMVLIERGNPSPSAAQVAKEAGVGLRTVFRLFDDMDTLYREIFQVIEAKIYPMIAVPLRGKDWRAKLRALADRRAVVFEMIMPFRISSSVRRFQSDFLLERHHQMVGMERSLIEALLPPHVLADKKRAKALHLALSFNSWRMLRHEEQLTVKQSYAIVLQILEDIIVQFPEDPAQNALD